ncbi:histone H3-like centromeric protein A [Ixodes scapularis]|uniref:histone H3-like centromeric protein A n=1 Tax=Ixodes scapularis TaxID=6945 RepID=UPI001AD65E21|nr:histone H3-like centromeric protein A [Ixodes scapularis]
MGENATAKNIPISINPRPQMTTGGAEPTPERRPPTPAPEPSTSKGPGGRQESTSPRRGNRRSKHRTPPWLRDIRRLQRTTRPLIPRLSFARVVREILQGLAPSHSDRYYMQRLALPVLQDASEQFVTNFLSASYLCSLHAKRQTLRREDIISLQNLLKTFGGSLAPAF